MGRRTLESLPKSALIGRKPIVLTKSNISSTDIIKYINNIEKLLQWIETSEEEFMVIGGAKIYQQFLPFVDTMYLTLINDNTVHEADTYFPEFNPNNWRTELLKEGIEQKTNYQIKKYIKK